MSAETAGGDAEESGAGWDGVRSGLGDPGHAHGPVPESTRVAAWFNEDSEADLRADAEILELEIDRLSAVVRRQATKRFLAANLIRHPASPAQVDPVFRRSLVASRARTAYEAIDDVQRSFSDDDASVRRRAHQSSRELLHHLYLNDRSDRDHDARYPVLLDRVTERVVRRRDPDKRTPPWSGRHLEVRLRALVLLLCVGCAATAGTLLVGDRPWPAAVVVMSLGGLLLVEASLGRVSSTRVAELRWASCVAGHACDVLIMGCIAYQQVSVRFEHGALAMTAATVVSLFGSFVRVSALQAGHRAWFSRRERQARYLAVLIILVFLPTPLASGVVLTGSAIIIVAALAETVSVVRAVLTGPKITGAILFLDSDHEMHTWPLDEIRPVASKDVFSGRHNPRAASLQGD